MLLLKLGSLLQKSRLFYQIKLPNISYLLVVLLPLLLLVFWYPATSSALIQLLTLQEQIERAEQKRDHVKRRLPNERILAWLEEYDWLSWQLSQPDATVERYVLQLQGINHYSQWQNLINNLLERYSLQPLSSKIEWLSNDLFDANFSLQWVEGDFGFPIIVIPERTYVPWLEGITLSALVYWGGEWRVKIQYDKSEVTLSQGDWLPELAARLVRLDKYGALFRQQYIQPESHHTVSTRENMEQKEKLISSSLLSVTPSIALSDSSVLSNSNVQQADKFDVNQAK